MVVLSVFGLDSPHAGAQPGSSHSQVQLALARICVSEAGFQTETNDCAAIHQVLKGRKGRGSLLRIMRLYSSRTFDRERTDKRRWIAFLNPRGMEPKGWPERTAAGTPHPEWRHYRDLWMDMQEHVADVVSGEVSSPCSKEPDHWGSRYGIDLRRAKRAGWKEVDCGETLNAFWSVPDRAGAS